MEKSVVYNVDGEIVRISANILAKYPKSLFAIVANTDKMVVYDESNAICINRENTWLGYILDFMKHKTLPKSRLFLDVVREEARFYKLDELVGIINAKLEVDPFKILKTTYKPQFDGVYMVFQDSHKSKCTCYIAFNKAGSLTFTYMNKKLNGHWKSSNNVSIQFTFSDNKNQFKGAVDIKKDQYIISLSGGSLRRQANLSAVFVPVAEVADYANKRLQTDTLRLFQ